MKDTEEILEASIKNIDKPSFEWKLNGFNIGTGQKLSRKFEVGENSILLNVTFNNQTISATKSIIVIDSVDGVNIREFAASKKPVGIPDYVKRKKYRSGRSEDLCRFIAAIGSKCVRRCFNKSTLFRRTHMEGAIS